MKLIFLFVKDGEGDALVETLPTVPAEVGYSHDRMTHARHVTALG